MFIPNDVPYLQKQNVQNGVPSEKMSQSQGWHTQRYKTMKKSELIITLHVFGQCEYEEETHAGTGKTWLLHTERQRQLSVTALTKTNVITLMQVYNKCKIIKWIRGKKGVGIEISTSGTMKGNAKSSI